MNLRNLLNLLAHLLVQLLVQLLVHGLAMTVVHLLLIKLLDRLHWLLDLLRWRRLLLPHDWLAWPSQCRLRSEARSGDKRRLLSSLCLQLQCPTVLLDLVGMALLLLDRSLVSLYIFVLHSVNGGDPQLHLGQEVKTLVFSHLPVFGLEVVKCISGESEERC